MNLETFAQHYAAFWQSILDSVRQAYALGDSLSATARGLGVSNPVDCFVTPYKVIEDARRSIFNTLIRTAEEQFGACGQPVKIDSCDFDDFLPDRVRGESDYDLSFDPVALARKLTELYGGQSGADKALCRVASSLIAFFHIKPNGPITFKRGGIVLDACVRIDDFDKKWGRCRLCYHSGEFVRQGVGYLARFAEWAGDGNTKLALEHWQSNLHYPAEVVSRQVMRNGDISVVTYQTRFEFRFSPSLSAQLQVFLGLYGNLTSEAA